MKLPENKAKISHALKGRPRPATQGKNHWNFKHRDPNETWPCLCGCGTVIPRWIFRANGQPMTERRYVLGHQSRGKKRPDFQKIVAELTKNGDTRNHPKGSDHWNWQNGKSLDRENRDVKKAYREWRTKVYARDNWTCRDCGYKGKRLIAHHILHWSTHPMWRLVVSNGLTLCRGCHKKHHNDIGIATRFKPDISNQEVCG